MIPEHLAEVVDAARERQAQRRQERAELQAARQHGLKIRKAAKLARIDQEGNMTNHRGDRSAPAPRDVTRTPADPPPRLAGIRAGYPGKAELGLADNVLRAALSKLARDPDPEARIAGAQLAAEAADTLLRLAGRAEQASTAYKRQQQAATKLGARLDRRRTEVQSRTVQKGQTP